MCCRPLGDNWGRVVDPSSTAIGAEPVPQPAVIMEECFAASGDFFWFGTAVRGTELRYASRAHDCTRRLARASDLGTVKWREHTFMRDAKLPEGHISEWL